MRIFKKRLTKWIPLGSFDFSGVQYIVFVRKNIKTGMLKFKTKRINGKLVHGSRVHPIIQTNLINTASAWEAINKKQNV